MLVGDLTLQYGGRIFQMMAHAWDCFNKVFGDRSFTHPNIRDVFFAKVLPFLKQVRNCPTLTSSVYRASLEANVSSL